MKHLPKSPSVLLAALAVLASCSSNTMSEEEQQIEPAGTPMRFSAPAVGKMDTRVTRASESLTTGFLVSTYKGYGTTDRQEVMKQYEALYQPDGWSSTGAKWNTVGTTADGFYQTQYEKYWDTSAFPYEFFAIAPAPVKDGSVISGFELTATNVKIGAATEGQTVADGVVTPTSPATEYLLSQMERRKNGSDATKTDDMDMLTGTRIGNGGDSPTKAVPLPFHHLSSKVRFGIYTTEHVSESQKLKIKDVAFKVTSADAQGFVAKANGYTANMGSAGVANAFDGEFTGVERKAQPVSLLTLSGPTENKFTEAYLEKHEWESRDKANAYFFECEGGLTQVPQENVKLTVSLTIEPTVGDPFTLTDVPLTLTDTDGNKVDRFTWKPNCFYTYYIIVRKLFSHDISFTATVSDWEDVDGKIDTDLED